MALSFCKVETPDDVVRLAAMADEIWHEYWPERIGLAQTDYMVEQFQSADAIAHDIAEHGYRYWILIDDEGREVGYTGGAPQQLTGNEQADAWMHHSAVVDERWPKRFFISKIYLYASERGKHYASETLAFYEQICKDEGFPIMYLTVNRENDLGVRAYLGRGFEIVESVDNAIGEGFTMYDYIMVKEIA